MQSVSMQKWNSIRHCNKWFDIDKYWYNNRIIAQYQLYISWTSCIIASFPSSRVAFGRKDGLSIDHNQSSRSNRSATTAFLIQFRVSFENLSLLGWNVYIDYKHYNIFIYTVQLFLWTI
jgi:hypothetical protein